MTSSFLKNHSVEIDNNFQANGERIAYHQKTKGRSAFGRSSLTKSFLLPAVKNGSWKHTSLELEFHTQTQRRRELEDRASTVERIVHGRNASHTAVD
jgi:hypothetical protein